MLENIFITNPVPASTMPLAVADESGTDSIDTLDVNLDVGDESVGFASLLTDTYQKAVHSTQTLLATETPSKHLMLQDGQLSTTQRSMISTNKLAQNYSVEQSVVSFRKDGVLPKTVDSLIRPLRTMAAEPRGNINALAQESPTNVGVIRETQFNLPPAVSGHSIKDYQDQSLSTARDSKPLSTEFQAARGQIEVNRSIAPGVTTEEKPVDIRVNSGQTFVDTKKTTATAVFDSESVVKQDNAKGAPVNAEPEQRRNGSVKLEQPLLMAHTTQHHNKHIDAHRGHSADLNRLAKGSKIDAEVIDPIRATHLTSSATETGGVTQVKQADTAVTVREVGSVTPTLTNTVKNWVHTLRNAMEVSLENIDGDKIDLEIQLQNDRVHVKLSSNSSALNVEAQQQLAKLRQSLDSIGFSLNQFDSQNKNSNSYHAKDDNFTSDHGLNESSADVLTSVTPRSSSNLSVLV